MTRRDKLKAALERIVAGAGSREGLIDIAHEALALLDAEEESADADEGRECLRRLSAMATDEGETWDLSENDKNAIAWVVGEHQALTYENDQLRRERDELRAKVDAFARVYDRWAREEEYHADTAMRDLGTVMKKAGAFDAVDRERDFLRKQRDEAVRHAADFANALVEERTGRNYCPWCNEHVTGIVCKPTCVVERASDFLATIDAQAAKRGERSNG